MLEKLDAVLVPMLEKFMEAIPGLELAMISTSSGSCLAHLSQKDSQNQISQMQGISSISREDSCVGAMFPFIVEQVSKLCWGECKTMTAFFENKTLVHVNLMPLVVSFVGSSDMSTGAITNSDMISRLQKGLEPLRINNPNF
uniref:Uncharacterized protein n=1 Tax=Aplanochytrium stocchinoi TaxID=215587 RepID=A0A7S3LHV1_9STRA|mmetsp:Transcript_581/g.698  ORF Transcript_581/g.698 Transcript_581/m.698 type:complete len:142 (+) Transcript_581:128-553(+)